MRSVPLYYDIKRSLVMRHFKCRVFSYIRLYGIFDYYKALKIMTLWWTNIISVIEKLSKKNVAYYQNFDVFS